MKKVQLGAVVQVLNGRETGNVGIVIGIESSSMVWITDGKARPVEKPKKKNIKHIQCTQYVGPTVSKAITQRALTNADVRRDINQYLGRKGCE